MTDWVGITNSAIAPKAPVTSELMTALRDNTVVTMWETVATIYDSAVDGNVDTIESPTLEDGWDYAIFFKDVFSFLEGSTGSTDLRIWVKGPIETTYKQVLWYKSDQTSSTSYFAIGRSDSSRLANGRLWFPDTRWDRPSLSFATMLTDTGVRQLGGLTDYLRSPSGCGSIAFEGKISNIKIDHDSIGTYVIAGGQIFLQRRRNEQYA